MTPKFSNDIRKWYREEFHRRTKLLAKGEGRIDWVNEGTRVSFSEICHQADIMSATLEYGSYNVVELRQMFGQDPLKC